MKCKLSWSTGLATLLALTLSAPAAAQSAKQVLQESMERYENRMANVDNFTVVQDVMGYETTSYFEKHTVDGHPMFVMKGMGGDETEDMGVLYGEFMELADHAEVKGTETVDGKDCYVVHVPDMSVVDWNPQMGKEDADFKAKSGTFYIDRDDYLLRKMVIDAEAQREGKTVPVTMEMMLKDYREVDGVVHPFLTEMKISGLTGSMSEEDMAKARESLEEMKAEMAKMDEAQRKMMESMMKGQMERLEEMVESGEMNVTITVKELLVNAGPPS
jgi:hypothetical protein